MKKILLTMISVMLALGLVLVPAVMASAEEGDELGFEMKKESYSSLLDMGIDVEAIRERYSIKLNYSYQDGLVTVENDGYDRVSIIGMNSIDTDLMLIDNQWKLGGVSDEIFWEECFSVNKGAWQYKLRGGQVETLYYRHNYEDGHYWGLTISSGEVIIEYSINIDGNIHRIQNIYAENGNLRRHSYVVNLFDGAYEMAYSAIDEIEYFFINNEKGDSLLYHVTTGWTQYGTNSDVTEQFLNMTEEDLMTYAPSMVVCLAHQWKEANFANPKTCVKCGLTEGEKLPDVITEYKYESYKTLKEMGIDIDAVKAAKTFTLDASYVDGRLTIVDNGYTSINYASWYTGNYFILELADGVWSAEITEEDRELPHTYITAYNWMYEFEGSEIYVMVMQIIEENGNTYTVQFYPGKVTVTYQQPFNEGTLEVENEYDLNGDMLKHTIKFYEMNGDITAVYYDVNGNLLRISLLHNSEWSDYEPDMGWVNGNKEYTDTISVDEICAQLSYRVICSHSWQDATTEAPKTCTLCGETEGEPLPPEVENPPVDDDPVQDTETTPTEGEADHSECTAPFWQRVINAILNFFRRLFALPVKCDCGSLL